MKIAHLAVTKNQVMKEDKVILDPIKQAEELKRRSEEDRKRVQEKWDAIDLQTKNLKEEKPEIPASTATAETKTTAATTSASEGSNASSQTAKTSGTKVDRRPKQDYDELLNRSTSQR